MIVLNLLDTIEERIRMYDSIVVRNDLGPVVRRRIRANPGLNFNSDFLFFCSKAFSWIIFSILFRASNNEIVDEKN